MAGFNNSDGEKNAYQQNLSIPIQEQKNSYSTRDILGMIETVGTRNPLAAQEYYTEFQKETLNPTSQWYNPYNQPTNRAVSNLAAYGFDTNNLNDDWFEQNNGWIASNLLYNGTTNSPSKPGKKATRDQQIAYELYQYQKSEGATRKAEQQWDALQQELTYLAQDKRRNYSDEEILGIIDWSKYKELTSMDDNKYYQPNEYNRSIGYSKDAMYGVLWKARNTDYTGDINGAMANSALGYGNVWKNNQAITDKKEKRNKDTYSPYSLGMTLDDEGKYFGVYEFTPAIIKRLGETLDYNDETAVKYYNNVLEAEKKTKKLEEEKKALDSDIDYLLSVYKDPKTIIDIVKSRDDYKELFALDETLQSTILTPTTRAINYRWADVEKLIRDKCKTNEEAETSAVDVSSTMEEELGADVEETPVETAPPAVTPAPTEAPAPASPTMPPPQETPAPPRNTPSPVETPAPKNTETPVNDDIGQFGKGNIDLNNRPVIRNEDGSISTEVSFSFLDEDKNSDHYGKEVLIPSVVDGKIVSEDEAIDHYYKTGEYLGAFDTPEEANEYAEKLHERQDAYYGSTQEPVNTPAPTQAESTSTPQPVNTPAPPQQITQQPVNTKAPTVEQAQEKAEQLNLEAAAPTVMRIGTDAEKEQMQFGRTTQFGNAAQGVLTIQVPPEQMLKNYERSITNRAKTEYTPAIKLIREQEAKIQQRDALQKELEESQKISDAYKKRNDAYEGITTGDVISLNQLNEHDITNIEGIQQTDAEVIRARLESDDPSEKWLGYKTLYDATDLGHWVYDGDFDSEWIKQFGISSNAGSVEEFLEAHPKLDAYANAIVNGIPEEQENVEQLTDEEYDDWVAHEENIEQLTKAISQLDSEINSKDYSYRNAIKTRDQIRNSFITYADASGKPNETLSTLEAWDSAVKGWTPYPQTSHSIWQDAAEQGMDTTQLSGYAALSMVNGAKEIAYLKSVVANPQAYCLNPTKEDLDNAKQKIAVLEKEVGEASQFYITTLPDFKEKAEEGKKMSTEGLSDLTKENILALTATDTTTLMGSKHKGNDFIHQFSEGSDASDYFHAYDAIANNMDQSEKDLYFYYLKENGEQAANDYLKKFANPINGMLSHRTVEERANRIQKWASGDAGNAAEAFVAGFYLNFAGNISSWGAKKSYEIRGIKNYDTNGLAFSGSLFTDAARGGVADFVTNTFGDNAEAINFIVNAINSAGDSYISSMATTGALKVLGGAIPWVGKALGWLDAAAESSNVVGRFAASATRDLIHALPMGKFAGDRAYRDAIADGATPTQASRMANATFFAETITEAVTVGNIQSMWEKGAAGEAISFFKELAKNGLEEAVGEGFNQWMEDRWETMIMGQLSTYNKMVESLVAQNIPRSKAEEIANQQLIKNIITASASGFISSGFSSTNAYVTGRVKGTRQNARINTMNEQDTSKLNAARRLGNNTNSAIAISAVLRNNRVSLKEGAMSAIESGYKSDAASKKILGMSGGHGDVALDLMGSIITAAGDQSIAAKEAVSFAALTKGDANNLLRTMCDAVANGGQVTTQDVSSLLDAVTEDKTGDKALTNIADYNRSIAEHKLAVKENLLLATTKKDSAQKLGDGNEEVSRAKENAATAERQKSEADKKVKSVEGNVQSAVAQQLENPTKEGNGPIEQACNELEGAMREQSQKSAEEQKAKSNAEQTEKKVANEAEQIMSEVRQEAQAQVDQDNANEAAQAQAEFEQAINTYKPVTAFSQAVEVPLATGTGNVKVTGIFASDNGKLVYTTTEGYISEDELNWDDVPTDVLDVALNSLPANINSVKPAAWLLHSLEATDQHGKEVTIIGFAGQQDDGTILYFMDSEGNVYEDEDLDFKPDSITGIPASQTIFSFLNGLEERGITLPEYIRQQTNPEVPEEVQMPEGFIGYPGGNVKATHWQTGEDVEIAGLVNDGEWKYVQPDGTVIPLAEVIYEPTAFSQWALEQTQQNENTPSNENPVYIGTQFNLATNGDFYLKFPAGEEFSYPMGDTSVKALGFTKNTDGELRILLEDGSTITMEMLANPQLGTTDSVKQFIKDHPAFAKWVADYALPDMVSDQESGHYLDYKFAKGEAEYWAQLINETLQSEQGSTTQAEGEQSGDYDTVTYSTTEVYGSEKPYLAFPASVDIRDSNGDKALGFAADSMGTIYVVLKNGTSADISDIFGADTAEWLENHPEFKQWLENKAIPSLESEGEANLGNPVPSYSIDHFIKHQFGIENTNNATYVEDLMGKKYLSLPEDVHAILTIDGWGDVNVRGIRAGANGDLRIVFETMSGSLHSASLNNSFTYDELANIASEKPEFAKWFNNTVLSEAQNGNMELQTGKAVSGVSLQYILQAFSSITPQNVNQQSTQAPVNDQSTTGDVIPGTNTPLKPWQKPKNHGKVNPITRNAKKFLVGQKVPTSAKFNKFFNHNAQQAIPYVTNADGTPRLFYRGYGKMGHHLHVEHESSPYTLPDGTVVYKNFYTDSLNTALTYSKTGKFVTLRNIKNWETAKAAMKDLGLDLIEAPNPNGNGQMGYQIVYKSHDGSWQPASTSIKNWFSEDELRDFKKTYGGKPTHDGIFAGYVASEKPCIINAWYTDSNGDKKGQNWTEIKATVTAPDGTIKSGTFSTDDWARWASMHGADALIIDGVRDNIHGGGDDMTEFISFKPEMFKSVFNNGNWSWGNADILALKTTNALKKTMESNPKANALEQLMGKPVSKEFKNIQQRLLKGESVSDEEVMNLQEFQWAMKNKMKGSSVDYSLLEEAKEKGGKNWAKYLEDLLPEEIVKRINNIRTSLSKRGSAVFDEEGNVTYNGEVKKEKRLDLIFGLPASGKSGIADYLSRKNGSRIFDADFAKEEHPQYMGGINEDYVHTESKIINDSLMERAVQNGENILFSVIGNNQRTLRQRIAPFIDAGYSIHVHMTDLDQNKAKGRMLGRLLKKGRFLDWESVGSIDPQAISDTFNAMKGKFDGYARWNTDVEEGTNPIATEYSSEDERDIFGSDSLLARTEVSPGREGNGNILELRMAEGGRSGELTPTEQQAEKVKGKLKSPQEIYTNIAKALGIGSYATNKFGRMSKATRGFYDAHGEYIAVRNSEQGNARVTTHETGHGIAKILGLTGTPTMVNYLKSHNKDMDLEAYSTAQLKDEAFAEFFRNYLTDEQTARDFAGETFYDEFERRLAANPKAYKAVQEAKNAFTLWQEATYEQRLEALVKYEKNGERQNFRKFTQNAVSLLVDRSVAAEDVVQFMREQNGGDVPISENLRAMSLLSNHSQKQAVNMLTDSLTDANGTRIADGLGTMLKKVGFKGTEKNIKLLERYMLALHSIDRDKQGKIVYDDSVGTPEERQAFIDRIKATRPDIANAEAAFQTFRHNFLQAWMVDTGYWSQDLLNKLEKMYPHYVPTFRVGGSVDSMNGVGGKTGKGYTLKAATGSTQDIYSPYYSFVGMVDKITSMVNLNRVARTFDNLYRENEGMGYWARPIQAPLNTKAIMQDQLTKLLSDKVDTDIMERVLEITDHARNARESTNNVLTVQREDGSVARYQFTEDGQELFKLLAGVQDRTNIKALEILGGLTRTMSMLTTGSNPLFAARNAVRDFQTSVNYGTWASNYLSGAAKWAKTFVEVWRGNSDEYLDYKSLGGGGWTRIDQNNRRSMKSIQDEMFGDDTSTVGKTAKWALHKLWDVVTMDRVNEVIEQTSRFAEYKYGKHDKSTVEGKQEAFLAAQDVTVDFSRSGNSELAQVLKKLVPFFNASTQGVYRTARQFSQNERGATGDTILETAGNVLHSRAATRFTKTVVNTALASALASALILKFGDDDDKDEFANILSSGIKANHLILPNPLSGFGSKEKNGQPPFLRIPLAQDPLGYAVHGIVTNAMWNGSTDEYAISLAAITDVIMDNLNPLGSGTVMQPLIDVSHNRTWYGSRLVRSNMEDWTDPTSQYNEDTPGVFRWLGRLFNTSPEIVEYLATQYTGFLGATAIPALTYDDNGEIGGLGALFGSVTKKWTADPYSSNDATNNFYDMAKDLETIKDEAKKDRPQGLLLRSLSPEQVASAYLEAEEMLSNDGLIGATKKAISDAYGRIDKINSNDSLSDSEKARLVREERRAMVDIVEKANDQMQAYRKKYISGETLTDRMFGGIIKRFTEGPYAHVPTDKERLSQTFKDDEGQTYMQWTMSLYDDISAMSTEERKQATGSNTDPKSLLPTPEYKFTLKGVNGIENEYEIPTEDRGRYEQAYKDAYSNYLIANGNGWETLDYKTKRKLISGARSAGNKAIKEMFAYDNGIVLGK